MLNLPLPILVTGGAAAILGAVFLYLIVLVKIDCWRMKKRFRDENDALRNSCEKLEERMQQLEETVREAEARAAVLVPPPSSRSGMNLNKRVQAARMSKRGERPEQIAAALGLPRNEVALLLKVQRMTMPG